MTLAFKSLSGTSVKFSMKKTTAFFTLTLSPTSKNTFNFMCRPEHKDFIVMSRCGGREITEATLIDNIRPVHSYDYVLKPYQRYQLFSRLMTF